MIILGIDPGANTGVATYHGGKLTSLQTIQPHRIPELIRATGAGRVVFEDSRLISHMFTTVKSRPAALKMAREGMHTLTDEEWALLERYRRGAR